MDNGTDGRRVPHSVEAEYALLGSLLLEPELMAQTGALAAEDFYSPANAKIYAALMRLHESGAAIDITTVEDALRRAGVYEDVGGVDALAQVIAEAPMRRNVKEYADIIKDHALTRRVISAADFIKEAAYGAHDSAEALLEEAESKIFGLSSGGAHGESIPIREAVFDTLTAIQRRSENRGRLTGISTGFRELDYKTSGLQPSDLVIIAARPSMGKTALALNMAVHAALKEAKSVMIFSLEMSRTQLTERMILSEALIDSSRVRNGDLNGMADWTPITLSAEALAGADITINDKPGISLGELRSACRRRQIERPIDLIVIDYMQLMTGRGRSESRQMEISEISRGLKQLARELRCPVICLSQLARGPESRPNHRPMLSDLRESGSIEQDADVVMFLYREAYYNKEDTVSPFEAELDVAKQRNGPTGKINLRWLPEFTKFTDPAPEEGGEAF